GAGLERRVDTGSQRPAARRAGARRLMTAAPLADAPPGRPIGRRIRGRALVAASWLACRLPERPLLALPDLAGPVHYRLAPQPPRRAGRNLTRVTRWLADHDLGSPATRAAATDGAALTRLVRDAFRNSARYYVQLARTAIVDEAHLDRNLIWENPDT